MGSFGHIRLQFNSIFLFLISFSHVSVENADEIYSILRLHLKAEESMQVHVQIWGVRFPLHAGMCTKKREVNHSFDISLQLFHQITSNNV